MLYPVCRTGLKQIRVGPRGEKGNRLVAYEAIGWFCGQHGGAMLSLVSFTSYICMSSKEMLQLPLLVKLDCISSDGYV